MNSAREFDDLTKTLADVFAMPESKRKSAAIKSDLYTRLTYQPVAERNFFLADISKTQGIEFEIAKTEFLDFAAATKKERAEKPYKPTPTPKSSPVFQRPAKDPNALPPDAGPLSIKLSEVEPQAVAWLWKDYFPIGEATLVSANPGDGKSFFIMDVAARVSMGTKWLDGSNVGEPANTLYLSVEDHRNKTIRPRIDSLGGDSSRINVYISEQPIHLNLSKEGGLERLENDIVKIGNVRLLVIDPIADFSGGINANAANEVRALMTPLIAMAAKHSFALVIIGHLNKNQTMGAIYRAGGSTSGWLGKVRAAFMIFRNIDDRTLRHVVALKANLAEKEPPQLEFRLTEGQLLGRVSTEQVDADEHLNPQKGRKPRGKLLAGDWLKMLFSDRDEIPSSEIEKAAKENGISFTTLKKAKIDGGYISKKLQTTDGKDQWVWVKI